jgi:diguanylate cyclase
MGLGHDVGDRVLCYVATQLARTMRPTDTVGRFGGDEFAVVVANLTNVEEAERIAQRGLHAIEEPFQLEDALLTLKASVGIACHPSDGDQPDHLLRRADVAMYRAKRLGGGLAAYEAHRDQDQLESLDLVAELQQAIENDQLLLCYQPKIHLRTGEAIGVECLVRWQHRTRGVMRPIQFIPLAESTGLIKALSVWVIKQAIADSRSWHASGVDVPVAVNLSAPLLYDRELPDIIRREVDAHHVGDGHLEVEITESALMLDPVEAVKTVKRLRARGITFALDDFGTGYSSLAQLKNLEVQTIKIDQSFVRQMVTDARDASIVKAAIELGHSLGLDVVAEGVESGEVREILDDLGCDHAQGFYFGKPMISPEFLTWIRQHDPGPFRRL